MKIRVAVMLVLATALCCWGTGMADRNRVRSRVFMRMAVLRSELQRNPQKFFDDYIAGQYTVHDGLAPVKLAYGNIVQIVDKSTILVRNQDYDMYVVRRINTSALVDGQQIRVILVPDGVYEYVTVLGASKRVNAYIPGRTINYEEFQSCLRAGHDFAKIVFEAENKP
jgi:hypothetical protein